MTAPTTETDGPLTLADLGTTGGYLAAGGREYGGPFLDAVNEAVVLWEQLALGKRDQGGNVTTKQTVGQILPRIIYETLRRFEGKDSDWPVDRTPIPDTTRAVSKTVTPRDQVYDILSDFLEQCRWSRSTHLDLVLADCRAYVKADAAEHALDRIEVVYGALLAPHRLPPDQEVMGLRERVRCLTELVDEARTKGFVAKGQPG